MSAKISFALLTMAALFNVPQTTFAQIPFGCQIAQSILDSLNTPDMQKKNRVQMLDAPIKDLFDCLSPFPGVKNLQGRIGPDSGQYTEQGVVRFALLLPVKKWNHKFIEVGCGGACRDYTNPFLALCPVHRGYACIITDMGSGRDDFSPQYHEFVNDWRRRINYGYRAAHVGAVVGKAIVKAYYDGQEPSKSLMMGCSAGGYEAMVEAQRFPWDFDGIVAIAPDIDEADIAMRKAWFFKNWEYLIEHAPDFKEVLHNAAIEQCGTKDLDKHRDYVENPMACASKFVDLSWLKCKPGQSTPCLRDDEHNKLLEHAQNLYRPITSRGQQISTPVLLPGSERSLPPEAWGFPTEGYDWADNWGTTFFRFMFRLGGQTTQCPAPYCDPFFPPDGTAPRDWNIWDFNFDEDYKRLGLGAVYTETNPDLRKFRDAGGKLMIVEGGADAAVFPWAGIDYYETVEKTMGGRVATQKFARLFVVPGMNHCTGGDGPFAIDYLTALEKWVEKGLPPGQEPKPGQERNDLIGAHLNLSWDDAVRHLKFPLDPAVYDLHHPGPDKSVKFTRPIYPYPQWAKYTGKVDKDRNKAENFESVGDDASALIALEQEWVEAIQKSDVKTLSTIFASTYVDTDETGQRADKAAVLKALKSGALKVLKIELSDMKPVIYADAAVVTGASVQRGTYKGRPLAERIVFTDTFIRTGKTWEAVRSQRTTAPRQ